MTASLTASEDMAWAEETRFAPIGGAGPVAFVAWACAISWAIWLLGWAMAGRPAALTNPGMSAAAYLGAFGPGIAAAVLSRRESRVVASEWARGFLRWNIGWRAAAVIALGLPLAMLALTAMLQFTPRVPTGQPQGAMLAYLALFPISIPLAAIAALLGRGPLGEEGGWRGYLLPRLLARTDALRSSALIGLVWSIWQLPIAILFADARMGLGVAGFVAIMVLRLVAMSYIATTVWRWSRGSLVACVWLQGMALALGGMAFVPTGWDSHLGSLSNSIPFAAGLWLVAIVLALIQRRRTGAW